MRCTAYFCITLMAALAAVSNAAGTGPAGEGIFLPAVAASGSEIVGTFLAVPGSAITQVFAEFELRSGARRLVGVPVGARGRFVFRLPSDAVAVRVSQNFNSGGEPDGLVERTVVSNSADVPGTFAIPRSAAAHAPAILRAATVYQGGANAEPINLQVRGIDPAHSTILLDGSPGQVELLAASSRAVRGRLVATAPLGRHTLSVESRQRRSNSVPVDLVSLRADPVAPSEVGTVQTVTVHVDGLPPEDRATMSFEVGGSAEALGGGSQAQAQVRDGAASIRVRGVRSGQALIRFHLQADLAAAPGAAQPEREVAQEPHTTSAPSESPRPSPTPTGISVRETAKPKISIYGHDDLAPCRVRIDDGWFEPTQGVWQDDFAFDDHPTKQLTRTDHGGPPAYNAELPMIVERDTRMYGIEHYRLDGAMHLVGHHGEIYMHGYTNCTGPPEPVKMRFTVFRGNMAERIFTSRQVTSIPFSGGRGKDEPWEAKLLVYPDGVPLGARPYRFTTAGPYRIEDELLRNDTGSGLKVTVSGQAVEVAPLRVGFLSAFLATHNADPHADYTDDFVHTKTRVLLGDSETYIPDYFPMRPNDLSTKRIVDDDDFTRRRATQSVLDDAIVAKYEDLARFSGLDRMVLVTNHKGMAAADRRRPLGVSLSQKVVLVLAGENFLTVAHELAHTMKKPPWWADDEMDADCSQPGNYHNKSDPFAAGVRLDRAGQPALAQFIYRKVSFMGGIDPVDQQWTDQCTFWYLANAMRKIPDPRVIVIRGVLARLRNGVSASLWPAYVLDSELSLPVAKPGTDVWSLHLIGAGNAGSSYFFTPVWKDENQRALGRTYFSFKLPAPGDVTRIELRGPHGESASVLTSAPSPFSITIDAASAIRGKLAARWHFIGPAPGRFWSSVTIESRTHWLSMPMSEARDATSALLALPRGGGPYDVHVWISDGTRSATAQATAP